MKGGEEEPLEDIGAEQAIAKSLWDQGMLRGSLLLLTQLPRWIMF